MFARESHRALAGAADALLPTVHVIDDDSGARAGLTALVNTMDATCKTFASAEDFLRADTAQRPGCLVLDLVLEGMSGEQLLEQHMKSSMPMPVVIISAYADVPIAVRCMERGAVTLIEKPCDDDALVNAIRKALAFDQEQSQLSRRIEKFESVESVLPERERKVLNLVVDGRLNKLIARDLEVSERTVENVRSRLMQKFDAENAIDLAAKYTEFKLLSKYAHRLSPVPEPHFLKSNATHDSLLGGSAQQA